VNGTENSSRGEQCSRGHEEQAQKPQQMEQKRGTEQQTAEQLSVHVHRYKTQVGRSGVSDRTDGRSQEQSPSAGTSPRQSLYRCQPRACRRQLLQRPRHRGHPQPRRNGQPPAPTPRTPPYRNIPEHPRPLCRRLTPPPPSRASQAEGVRIRTHQAPNDPTAEHGQPHVLCWERSLQTVVPFPPWWKPLTMTGDR